MSNEIVLARVVEVNTVKGVKIARVKVLETYKGKGVNELLFLAQPTWTCDIAEAVKGETALLFLTTYVGGRDIFGRLPTRKELEGAGIRQPMFLIPDSGRGRMPLREIRGERYLTVWVTDVRLPALMPTISGPEPKYTFIRSVPLNQIENLLGSSGDAKQILGSKSSIAQAP